MVITILKMLLRRQMLVMEKDHLMIEQTAKCSRGRLPDNMKCISASAFIISPRASVRWCDGRLGGHATDPDRNVLVKRLGPLPMLPLMAWLSLVPPLPSLVVAWLLYPTGPSLPTAIIHASYESLLAILYIGVVATVIAYAMWGGLLARYSTAVVGPFALLALCTGVLASAVIFEERFDATRYAGMALIVAGLAFIIMPTARGASMR